MCVYLNCKSHKIFGILLFALIIIISACSKQNGAENNSFIRNIEFEYIKQGSLSMPFNNQTHLGVVINDSTAWNQYYIDSNFNIPILYQNIDFDHYSIIFLIDSQRHSAPATLNVQNISEYKYNININTVIECCGPMDVINYPFTILKTAKLSSKPIVLLK